VILNMVDFSRRAPGANKAKIMPIPESIHRDNQNALAEQGLK